MDDGLVTELRENGFGLHVYTHGKLNQWKLELIDWEAKPNADVIWDNADASDTLEALLLKAHTAATRLRKEWH